MAGVAFSIDMRGLEEALAKFQRLAAADRAEIMDMAGAVAESAARRRIVEEKTSPNGQAWAPWSAQYAKTRHSGHSLLSSSGSLADSLTRWADAQQAQVGSNIIYAAIHQFGDSNTPARPYLGLSDEDAQDIADVITNFMGSLLR